MNLAYVRPNPTALTRVNAIGRKLSMLQVVWKKKTFSDIFMGLPNGYNNHFTFTFPEYLMCKKLNINPIIISCLTNYGAGLINKAVSHKDVLLNAKKVKNNFISLLLNIIENIELQKILKK